jgi:hypothetical protein
VTVPARAPPWRRGLSSGNLPLAPRNPRLPMESSRYGHRALLPSRTTGALLRRVDGTDAALYRGQCRPTKALMAQLLDPDNDLKPITQAEAQKLERIRRPVGAYNAAPSTKEAVDTWSAASSPLVWAWPERGSLGYSGQALSRGRCGHEGDARVCGIKTAPRPEPGGVGGSAHRVGHGEAPYVPRAARFISVVSSAAASARSTGA